MEHVNYKTLAAFREGGFGEKLSNFEEAPAYN